MKLRRNVLIATVVIGLAALSGMAQAQPILKIAYETSDTHIKARSALMFKQELEKRAAGQITVQTFPNASLLPSRQEISGAVQNQVQMVLPFVSFYEAVSPKAGIFTMPMLFRDYDHLQKAADGAVGKAVYDDLATKGLKAVAFWYETPTHIFTSRKEINDMAAIKGAKVRIYPSAALEGSLRRLGANPAVIPGNEVYLALQNGTVDAAVTTPSFAQSLKLTDVLKTMTRVNLVLGGYIVALNKGFYDGLSPQLRTAVDQSIAAATEFNKREIREEVKRAEDAMVKAGVKIIDLAPQERARWVQTVQPVLDSQSGDLARLIADAQKL
ncbi:MAG: TRAP transporter substrate-binding protein [Burkholderiales bacterium]|nr:TRAP transporter substrate-binding protein [Burkholderiales bacterium]